jgi:nicotinamide riboside kinase
MKIALLGAESTGKTQLARDLAAHLRLQGKRAEAVPEVLREWCTRERREPSPEEQLPIAQEQEARVDAAALRADIVITDTTALMVAIYSGMAFEDGELFHFALKRQRGYDITLLCALDLPWMADGLQRIGPEVRESVDAQLRDALQRARLPYRVVYGSGGERLLNALAAIDSAPLQDVRVTTAPSRPWTWSCEKCSDPDCEHRLFTGLWASPAAGRRAR